MGNPLTTQLAELKLQKLEKEAISSSLVPLHFWRRFVDDVYGEFKKDSDNFHSHLNSFSTKLQFTIEHPKEGQLPFLDTIIHLSDQSLSVYRKPTHTNRYLNYKSCHPQATKDGIVTSLVDRALTVCDPHNIQDELQSISKTFQCNGYPKHKVQNIINQRIKRKEGNQTNTQSHLKKFKHWVTIPFIPKLGYKLQKILNRKGVGVHFSSGQTLKTILSKPKSPSNPNTKKNVIYKINCECDKVYIGQTSQPFTTRLKQHMADLKPSIKIDDVKHSTAEHQRNTGHIVAWDYPEIVASTKWRSQLNTYENLAIDHYKAAAPNGLNKDIGPYISNTWKPLYSKVKFSPKRLNL